MCGQFSPNKHVKLHNSMEGLTAQYFFKYLTYPVNQLFKNY